ncbi:MAG: SDR family NAD(P)-dependent oxidoreductase, partial [Thermohalobaculum sp.]|nr:SDR family NAD(P)-dependent oxidoreductase [Thermohalobaculum sp.]
RPDTVLGHSAGAFAAAALAGVYTPEDAADLVAERAALMGSLPEGGAMLALITGEAEAIDLCHGIDGIGIAALNGPANVVVSGEAPGIDAIEARATRAGIATRRLQVSHAFHSPLMAPAATALAAFAAGRTARAPALAFVSDMTGAVMTAAPDGQYLADHVLRPVRFADGLRALAALGCTDFIEVGPGGALRGFAAATLAGDQIDLHGLLSARGDDWAVAMTTLGRLWEKGQAADIAALYRQRGARRAAAPLYPFARTRYWLTATPAAAAGTAQGLSGTELRVPGDARRFQGAYSVAARPWIADHRVYRHITLPVAAALAGLAEAGARVAGQAVEVRALTYREACVLDGEETVLVDIEVPRDLAAGPAVLSSCVTASGTDTPWRKHIEARLHPGVSAAPTALDLAAARAECSHEVAPAAFYETLDRLGLTYGRGFRNVRDLRLGEGVALARISADADLAGEAGADAALVHPAILDACLHIYPAVSGLHGIFDALPPDGGTTFLPITVERFAVFAPVPSAVWSLARLRPGERPGDGRYVLDIRIHADDGSPLALIEGLAVKRLPEAAFLPRARAKVDDWLYRIDWVARPALPLSEPSPRGRWLVIAETPGDVRPITDALEARGADWCVLRADDLIEASRPETAGSDLPPEVTAGPPIAGVLLATALGTPPLMGLEPADLARETERQFLISTAALHLTSETLASDANQPRLWILTRGAQAPLGDHLGGEALQAVLWGHGRVIALEHPAVHGGLIDIDDRTDGAAVLDEIFGGDGEDQIALRDRRRFAPRLVRNRADDGAVPVGAAIQAGRSYLVTGGLGTLGLKVAGWLVRAQGARHLWLVSRRAPSTQQQAEIAALEAMGAVIHAVSADMSDPDEVAALIARIETDGPALHGVFHCAGLLDDGIMIEMDWARYHRVTAAKIEGAWALHRATEHLDLGHFVLFSSILSVIGSMGQLNYVAGNAFLDALVAYRRRLGLAATALNWGPWEDAGLATESGERGRSIWRARGTRYIPADEGIEAMAAALAQDADHMVVTLTDWDRFVTQFARPPKLYDALARGASGAGRQQRIDRARILEQLRALSPDRRHGPLVEALGQICATILDTGVPLDPNRSLREAGLDSLMSISVINEIEAVFGTRLPARALLRGPSVMELAQMVLSALPDLGTPGPADTGAAPGAAAQPSPPPSRPPPDQARTGGAPGAWLVIRRPRPDARVQLVCFPFAGGGSAVFDGWGDAFDPAVEIVAVEPPGRLGRINEAPVRTVEDFARGLLPELAARLDRPYAVLGHCLGGLTLYETLRFLQARKLPMPAHIFVSGARPPSVLKAPGDFERELDARLRGFAEYQAGRPGFEQPDAVFSEVIRAFGISESSKMLDVEELRGIVLPTVRAEFQMANRYVYLPEAPFPVPLTCFRGVRDAYFRDIDAGLWRKFTSKRFELFTRDTGHFALVEDFDFIRRTVESRLLGQCADSA